MSEPRSSDESFTLSLLRESLSWAGGFAILSLALLPLATCRRTAPEPRSPPLDPATVVQGIVARSIGSFASDLRDVVVNLREHPGEAPTAIWLANDGRMRIDRPGIGSETMTSTAAYAWTSRTDSRALSDARRAALAKLRASCRSMLCLPLLGASKLERTARDTIRFVASDASASERGTEATWTLRHNADGTLRSLASEASGRVDFVEFKPPPGMVLPRVIEITGLAPEFCGRRWFELSAAASQFDENTFLPPDRREGRPAPRDLQVQPADLPLEPRFEILDARRWLVLDDPGTWALRKSVCLTAGTRLGEHDQIGYGDPMLIEPGQLVIPFEADENAAPYEASATETVRDVAEHTVVAVLAQPGDSLEARVAAAKAQLESFLAAQGRESAGPLRVVVNVFYTPNLGVDDTLPRTMEVRVELPVAN